MVRRKVRDEAEAVALIEEARRSGVRPSKVAAKRGIDGRSIHAWSMVLARRKPPPPAESTFLELVPTRPAVVRRSYRVWVGDLSVEVPDGFDEHTVHRLVTVLQAC